MCPKSKSTRIRTSTTPVASDEHGNLVANSGRVLLVETSAPDIKSAQDKVYAIIDKLELRGLFYRHDIGFKALK